MNHQPSNGEILQVTIISKDNMGYLVNMHGYETEGFVQPPNRYHSKYKIGSVHTAEVIRIGIGRTLSDEPMQFTDLKFKQ